MRKCPQCGSSRVKRSHARDLKERVLKTFDQRAYRCINCGWRGIQEGKTTKPAYSAKYSLKQIIIIILFVLSVTIALLYLFMREPEKQEIPVQVGIALPVGKTVAFFNILI